MNATDLVERQTNRKVVSYICTKHEKKHTIIYMNETNEVYKRMAVILPLTIIYMNIIKKIYYSNFLHAYICAFSIIFNMYLFKSCTYFFFLIKLKYFLEAICSL